MAVTVALSLLAFTSENVWRFFALEPFRMMREHQYHQLITGGLIHADFAHLFINMFTLFVFGPQLESIVGGPTFIVIYGVSLVVGNLYPFFKFRNNPEYIAIGASGAVSGILFSFCLYEPTRVLYYMFIPMPAFVFAILYVLYSAYSMRTRNDNIGHEAHLAGALAGIVATTIANPGVIEHLVGQFG